METLWAVPVCAFRQVLPVWRAEFGYEEAVKGLEGSGEEEKSREEHLSTALRRILATGAC